MEEEFEKEATKRSPNFCNRSENGFVEGTVTGPSIASAQNELGREEPDISDEILPGLIHSGFDAASLRATSTAEINICMLQSGFAGDSVQTSLAQFDDANAPLDGHSDDPPHALCDLYESSRMERAMEQTLFLDDLYWSATAGDASQLERYEAVQPALTPGDTDLIGTLDEASLETEGDVTLPPIVDLASEPFSQAPSVDADSPFGVQTPQALPSTSYKVLQLPTSQDKSPANVLAGSQASLTTSTGSSVPYLVPTPVYFVSPSPFSVSSNSDGQDNNDLEGRIEGLGPAGPLNPAPLAQREAESVLHAPEIYYHKNGSLSVPTPMYPIPKSSELTIDAASSFDVHTANDSDVAFQAAPPAMEDFFSADAEAETMNAVGTPHFGIGTYHASTATYKMPSPLDVAANAEALTQAFTEGQLAVQEFLAPVSNKIQRLRQLFSAVPNRDTPGNVAGGHPPVAAPYTPTPMVHDNAAHEKYGLGKDYMPAMTRDTGPYRSRNVGMLGEDSKRLRHELQIQSSAIDAYGRRRYGAPQIAGYPAIARSHTNTSMEDNASLTPPADATKRNRAFSEYVRANNAMPSLTHEDSSMSMEVGTGAATDMAPGSSKHNEAPSAIFAAGVSKHSFIYRESCRVPF